MKQNKSNESKLSHEHLLAILEYFPDIGIFVWKERNCKGFSSSGKEAGCKHKIIGRHYIKINNISYFRSRLAWFYVHGVWPKSELDHRNMIKDDDRIENLREATRQQNLWNRNRTRREIKNKNLPRCITIVGKRFKVVLKHENKPKYLGTFDDLNEAIKCRDAFEFKHRKFLYS
tara:strand:- start:13 stop:534 length:522 start_codon:yes stop_codon:yes gene_type:complete